MKTYIDIIDIMEALDGIGVSYEIKGCLTNSIYITLNLDIPGTDEITGVTMRISDHSGRGDAMISMIYYCDNIEEIGEEEEKESFLKAQEELKNTFIPKMIDRIKKINVREYVID